MTKLNQKGSSHIVALLGVLVIAVVGFVGYRALNASEPKASSSTTPVAAQVKTPATISNTTDVRKADSALSSTTIDGSVNPNTLDSDINSL